MRLLALAAGLVAVVGLPAFAQSPPVPGAPDAAATELQSAWTAESVDYQHVEADHQRVENALGGFVRERSGQVAALQAELAKAQAKAAPAARPAPVAQARPPQVHPVTQPMAGAPGLHPAGPQSFPANPLPVKR